IDHCHSGDDWACQGAAPGLVDARHRPCVLHFVSEARHFPVAARYYWVMSLITEIIAQDPVGMEQLRAVRTLALPDWCIAAGFVRNRVWAHLHGIAPARPPADIDVLFYDAADLSKEREYEFEDRLDDLLPGLPWQVRNQARMHLSKGLPQHRSTADSM